MKKIILSDPQLNELVGTAADKILDGAGDLPDAFDGEKILGFAEHGQVNKFILFQIYQDWSAHMKKMEHPYFDYQDAEVKQGLRDFQNIVSDHIKVPQEDFRRMLQQAIYNTLKLILNPEDAVGNFFFREADQIPLELFRRHMPYFENFDYVLKALLKYFEKHETNRISRREFFEKFHKVIDLFEKKNDAPVLEYQKEKFQHLTGIELEGYMNRPAPPVKEPTSRRISVNEEQGEKEKTISERFQQEEKEGASLNERFAQQQNEGKSVLERMKEEKAETQPAEEKAPARRTPNLLQQRRSKTETQKDESVSQAPEKDTSRKSTIDLFAERKRKETEYREKRTIAEKLGQQDEGKTTLNEQVGEAKSIRTDQIPVHKQFQYVQKVFGGSSVKFKVVLDKINKTLTIDEARSVLERYVFNDPSVNRNDKVCKEFEELVKGRFEGGEG